MCEQWVKAGVEAQLAARFLLPEEQAQLTSWGACDTLPDLPSPEEASLRQLSSEPCRQPFLQHQLWQQPHDPSGGTSASCPLQAKTRRLRWWGSAGREPGPVLWALCCASGALPDSGCWVCHGAETCRRG